MIHKNVCPSSILVTKKGTWKLAGFEFIGNVKNCFLTFYLICHSAFVCLHLSFAFVERCHESDAVEPVVCQPWSTRLSKMAQPNLDYMGEDSCVLIFSEANEFEPSKALERVEEEAK